MGMAVELNESAPPTVLVVDDEAGPREAFRLVLERRFNVLTAEDGWTALDLLREKDVDVVTLDLMMPAISGLETLKRIRETGSDVEVLVVSAMPVRSMVAECTRLGAFAVLAKPFSRADIIAAADRAAESRKARRLARQDGVAKSNGAS